MYREREQMVEVKANDRRRKRKQVIEEEREASDGMKENE